MSTPTHTASFKPALLRAAITYTLENDTLTATRAREVLWEVHLSDVTSARYADIATGRYRMQRLDLQAGGTRRRIALTTPARSSLSDEALAAFRKLVAAISERLAEIAPRTEVRLGEGPLGTWVLFGIGMAGIIMSLGVTGMAMAGRMSSDRLLAGAVPILMLLVFSGSLVIGFNPWRGREALPVQKFAVLARLMADGTGKQVDDQNA